MPRPHRPAVAAVIVALVLGPGPALAGTVRAAGTGAEASSPAALTPIACEGSAEPDLRKVSVTAIMRHRPGTRHLSVRLELTERVAGEGATVIHGGDLGRWVSPAVATLGRGPDDVWRLAKAVYGVPAPATYRFAAEFRWEGAGGRVIARQRLRSGSCAVRTQ